MDSAWQHETPTCLPKRLPAPGSCANWLRSILAASPHQARNWIQPASNARIQPGVSFFWVDLLFFPFFAALEKVAFKQFAGRIILLVSIFRVSQNQLYPVTRGVTLRVFGALQRFQSCTPLEPPSSPRSPSAPKDPRAAEISSKTSQCFGSPRCFWGLCEFVRISY